MTSRKPPGADWESWIDQVIRDGRDRGEFDDLPGNGKPLPGLDKPRDEMWWVRKKVQSEGISYLPPALALRKDREDTLTCLDTETSETRVRRLLEELNSRIRDVNSRSITGPPSTVMPVDIERLVQGWRARRTHGVAHETRRSEERGTGEPSAAWPNDGPDQPGADTSSTPKKRRGGPTAAWLRWPTRKGADVGELE